MVPLVRRLGKALGPWLSQRGCALTPDLGPAQCGQEHLPVKMLHVRDSWGSASGGQGFPFQQHRGWASHDGIWIDGLALPDLALGHGP